MLAEYCAASCRGIVPGRTHRAMWDFYDSNFGFDANELLKKKCVKICGCSAIEHSALRPAMRTVSFARSGRG